MASEASDRTPIPSEPTIKSKLSVEASDFVPGAQLPKVAIDRTYSKLDRVPFSPANGVVTPSPYSRHMAHYYCLQQCADGQYAYCWSPVSAGGEYYMRSGKSGSSYSPSSVLGPVTPRQSPGPFLSHGSSPADSGSGSGSSSGTPRMQPAASRTWPPDAGSPHGFIRGMPPHSFYPSSPHGFEPGGMPQTFHPGAHGSPFYWQQAVPPMAPLTPGMPPQSPAGHMPPSPAAFMMPMYPVLRPCTPHSLAPGQRQQPGSPGFQGWQQPPLQCLTPQMNRRSGLGRTRSGGSQKASHSPRPPPPIPLLLPADVPSASTAQQPKRVPLAEMPSGKVATAEPAAAQLSPGRKASGLTVAHEQQLVLLLDRRGQMGDAAPKELDDLTTLLETDGSVSSMNARQRRTMRRAIERAAKSLKIVEHCTEAPLLDGKDAAPECCEKTVLSWEQPAEEVE